MAILQAEAIDAGVRIATLYPALAFAVVLGIGIYLALRVVTASSEKQLDRFIELHKQDAERFDRAAERFDRAEEVFRDRP